MIETKKLTRLNTTNNGGMAGEDDGAGREINFLGQRKKQLSTFKVDWKTLVDFLHETEK